jgi:hypothetical protein
MRCIPSFAVMSATDREWSTARQQLVAFLNEAGPISGRDAAAEADGAVTYLCSIPCRQDGGIIRYAHLFQHNDRLTQEPAYFRVAASPDWWPKGCRSLPPLRRTSERAPLRLRVVANGGAQAASAR